MILYHGSSVGNLSELKPFVSEHTKPYIYLSSNPVVALLYAVKPVPKPFSFYPYGFRGNQVVYSEYYCDCFKDLYKGRKGFLYECNSPGNLSNPTNINCAYTCAENVPIIRCTVVDDLYEKFMDYKEQGLFDVKPYENIDVNELAFVYEDLRKNFLQYHLKDLPDHPMSRFIAAHFPEIML